MKKIIALIGLTSLLLFAGTALAQEQEQQQRPQEEFQAQQKGAKAEFQAQQKREQEGIKATGVGAKAEFQAKEVRARAEFSAQQTAAPADPFGGALFPPELIMQHQREIGLTAEQRDRIRAIIREIQPQFQDLQWEIQDANEAMRELLERPSVDEAGALTQLNTILDNERRVKRLQVTLMIRIKNTLNEKQQQTLHEMRKMREVRVGRVSRRD